VKLARRLESTGFPAQQAGDMAEAITEAVSQLVTKADLAALRAELRADIELLKRDMTIRFGSMMIIAVGIITGFKFIHREQPLRWVTARGR
jgi:hypothetical protein